jgi:4-hydroxy-2-oxoglutarate aldolase
LADFLPSVLDIPSFERHLLRVAKAGVSPLIAGTMGEAIHLSHSERVKLIQVARKVLNNASLTHVPIIAGTGAGSTRETVELTLQAAGAGADYAIVIASGYFAGVLMNDREALKAFWAEIADKSLIPVMIYNCIFMPLLLIVNANFISPQDPSASGGIDLDSDFIIQLAKECPNICGVKLTYANFILFPLPH